MSKMMVFNDIMEMDGKSNKVYKDDIESDKLKNIIGEYCRIPKEHLIAGEDMKQDFRFILENLNKFSDLQELGVSYLSSAITVLYEMFMKLDNLSREDIIVYFARTQRYGNGYGKAELLKLLSYAEISKDINYEMPMVERVLERFISSNIRDIDLYTFNEALNMAFNFMKNDSTDKVLASDILDSLIKICCELLSIYGACDGLYAMQWNDVVECLISKLVKVNYISGIHKFLELIRLFGLEDKINYINLSNLNEHSLESSRENFKILICYLEKSIIDGEFYEEDMLNNTICAISEVIYETPWLLGSVELSENLVGFIIQNRLKNITKITSKDISIVTALVKAVKSHSFFVYCINKVRASYGIVVSDNNRAFYVENGKLVEYTKCCGIPDRLTESISIVSLIDLCAKGFITDYTVLNTRITNYNLSSFINYVNSYSHMPATVRNNLINILDSFSLECLVGLLNKVKVQHSEQNKDYKVDLNMTYLNKLDICSIEINPVILCKVLPTKYVKALKKVYDF